MKIKDFNKLIKTESPKKILFRYMYACYDKVDGIYLTNKQLEKVIQLKNSES